MYRERPSRLAGAFVWTRHSSPVEEAGSLRVLPDGCIDLLYIGGSLLVAGPDTTAWCTTSGPGRHDTAAVRFPPGSGGRILGFPVSEIRDRRVPLDQFWPRMQVQQWESRLRADDSPAAALELLVLDRSDRVSLDRWPAFVTMMLDRGAGVGEVARELGWGPRLLHRRSIEAFGYAPSRLGRILRLQRAVALARRGAPLAEVAGRCGYADQAHLAKETKALAGISMGGLV